MQTTCVIFTKNRQLLIHNCIDFYKNYYEEIIVLDGSEENILFADEGVTKRCKYFWLPKSSMLQRLKLLTTLIRTDNVILSPDDDIIIPSRANKAISLLSKSCKMVYGDQLGASVNSNRIIYHPLWIWSGYFDISSRKTAVEKLCSVYIYIQSARFFWGVYEANHLKSLIDFISKNDQAIWQYEAAFTFFNIISGDAGYLPATLFIRNTIRDAVDKKKGKLKPQGNEQMKKVFVEDKAMAIQTTLKMMSKYFHGADISQDAWNLLGKIIIASESENNNAEELPKYFSDICMGTLRSSELINETRKVDPSCKNNIYTKIREDEQKEMTRFFEIYYGIKQVKL